MNEYRAVYGVVSGTYAWLAAWASLNDEPQLGALGLALLWIEVRAHFFGWNKRALLVLLAI